MKFDKVGTNVKASMGFLFQVFQSTVIGVDSILYASWKESLSNFHYIVTSTSFRDELYV